MCVWVFQKLLGVCGCVWGGFLLDRNKADLAVVWSYGIILHPNIMWACMWRSTSVAVGVSSTFGSVLVCVCVGGGGGGFPLDRNQVDLAVVESYGLVLHQNIMWACLWSKALISSQVTQLPELRSQVRLTRGMTRGLTRS